jgi:MoaA/NifB/PqqE/SkfB family radical SAM enzyme
MPTSNRPRQYPAAMVNITNRCNLRCKHCFVFREGNPNQPAAEMGTETMLEQLRELKEERGIHTMLWMGGEPLIRPDVLREGVKIFPQNNITTNGTLPLLDLPNTIYVVSLDGPPAVNDLIRGKGTFDRVMENIEKIPEGFGPTVMCQCVVTRKNEKCLEELVERLRPSRFEGMTFSFYVPRENDDSDLTWGSLERRDTAVHETMRLKAKYPDFIWNNRRALELTLSPNAKAVTDHCPSQKYVMSRYLDGDRFVSPFCCYGNDVDCDLCGAWVVFYIAEKLERAATNG